MAELADLETEQIRQHLITGGFIASFTDIFGNPQPAPIYQDNELNLTNQAGNSRVVMIRVTGSLNSGNRTFFKSVPMVLVVVWSFY